MAVSCTNTSAVSPATIVLPLCNKGRSSLSSRPPHHHPRHSLKGQTRSPTLLPSFDTSLAPILAPPPQTATRISLVVRSSNRPLLQHLRMEQLKSPEYPLLSARPTVRVRPPDLSMRPKFFRTAPASSESRLEVEWQTDREEGGRGLKESRKQLIKRSRECERQPKTEQSKTHEKTTFYSLLHVRRSKKGPIISVTSIPLPVNTFSFILLVKGRTRALYKDCELQIFKVLASVIVNRCGKIIDLFCFARSRS